MEIVAVINSRIWLPPKMPKDFERDLRRALTHPNPEYHKKKAMGYATWNTPTNIKTFAYETDRLGKRLTLARGATGLLKEIAAEHGIIVRWMDARTESPAHFETFCVSESNPEYVLRDFQEFAVCEALKRQQGIIRAPTGCLAPDTVVECHRHGKSYKTTIEKLYKSETNHDPRRKPGITKIRSVDDEGFVRLFELTDVFQSGVKKVFTVTLEDGATIEATKDHRFKTLRGWKRLSQFVEGEMVAVDRGRDHWRNVTPKIQYRRADSIDYSREVMTYDIEVEDTRNFIANGFMVHNSGKTIAALSFIQRAGQRALVVMRDGNLLEQWVDVACECLDIAPSDIGIIRGGKKYKPGKRIVFALQQSLSSKEGAKLDAILKEEKFGCVVVDEVQTVAARTFLEVVNKFPCKYRIGFSADECVASGTLVTMGDGSLKPIEQIKEGDLVKTPLGTKKVLKHHDTGFQKTVKVVSGEHTIRCTGDTWFATSRGWQNHESLRYLSTYVDLHSLQQATSQRLQNRIPHKIPSVGSLHQRRQMQNVCEVCEEGQGARGDVRSLRVAERSDHDCKVEVERDWLSVQTYDLTIEGAECFYANGFLVHNTRKDQKEFLIYDLFGSVVFEISRNELEDKRIIHPVTIRVIPTAFRADWYRDAEPVERDFNQLINEMTSDQRRNDLLLDTISKCIGYGETPAVVFTHRREHARQLADEEIKGIGCGLLLGGTGVDKTRFQEDRQRLLAGELPLAIGTFNALGVGHNFPTIRAGVVATPISKKNKQFFGQVRGRICRTSEGKEAAALYYLADLNVFPDTIKTLSAWNDGRVEVWKNKRWNKVTDWK